MDLDVEVGGNGPNTGACGSWLTSRHSISPEQLGNWQPRIQEQSSLMP